MVPRVHYTRSDDSFLMCPNCGAEDGICLQSQPQFDLPGLNDIYKVREGGMTLYEWGMNRPGKYITAFCLKCYKPVLVVQSYYPVAGNAHQTQISETGQKERKNHRRVYTRTGDGGETSLIGGRRVAKSCDQVEAYGDVDELNALLGHLAANLPRPVDSIGRQIRSVQAELMQVGAWIAASPAK